MSLRGTAVTTAVHTREGTKQSKTPMKDYYVYIIMNYENTVLYTGITNNLERRMYEHKSKLIKGFSSKYNLNKLVYFEQGNDIYAAIAREKQIKGGSRAKKIELIETTNAEWRDLSKDWNS